MAQRKPFRPVSVLLSIAVLAIAVLAYIQYQSNILSTEEATLRSKLFVMRDAIDAYQSDRGTCPESLSQLVAGKYLPSMPVDPSTKLSATWNYTQIRTERGMVCDVRTTSPKVGRDGRRYADW